MDPKVDQDDSGSEDDCDPKLAAAISKAVSGCSTASVQKLVKDGVIPISLV